MHSRQKMYREVAGMRIENLGKAYGNQRALDNISLEIEEGKITAVLGESGAGKTTLLNAIAGLMPYEGTVDDREGTKEKRREGCSYLLQGAKLLPHLSAEANIKFVLPKSEWEKIPAMLERVGLKGKEKKRPAQLSGGERQRVAIARAFLFPHKLLLMDEPFSSVDLSLKKSLSELVVELWQERRETVVFVTHDVHEAALIASRAVVLKGGRVALDIPVPEPYPRDFLQVSCAENALVKALLA